MKQVFKNLRWIIVSLFLIILLLISHNWAVKNKQELEQQHFSKMDPVIMIPGSNATQNRFDSLVMLLNKNSIHKHDLLKLTVQTNNKITYTGSTNLTGKHPVIVIAFTNNKDGYSNIKKQAEWLRVALEQLIIRYHFNHFDALGHSNGGLIYTYFLEHDATRLGVRVQKFMTMGSPFNLNKQSITDQTQMLADFIKYRENLPKQLEVTSVTGAQNYSTDGLVPVNSAAAEKYVFQEVVKNYTVVTVTGSNAEHSDLPQNPQVVNLVQKTFF
ncbi:alpha/beta hydrolase [Companilactobacillus insicii]|uniref:alpha/beta hydrolase n=1 Tax=Companilactobacillus insicii TaxID=1732567 RepID=UPI000F7A27FD|nr:alpha/beta hydrolase [Companilactobacillus insicii]